MRSSKDLQVKDKQLLAKALLVKAKAEAKRDYYTYVKYTHPGYEYNMHGEYISNVIQDMLTKRDDMLSGKAKVENQYLILSIPPRHGKSMHITETLPGYFMGRYPRSKVILTAYSSTLADDFARSNASKIEQYDIFGTTIKANNQDRMILSNDSVLVKAGILGGITGKGANLLIIDDPIKTSEEAHSEVTRNKIWREWESSLSTRLEQAAIVIVIMTRWHEDDLVGRLLNKEYGKPLPWNVINLPLEAEENDILGRNPGEPLWADRYGCEFIAERKAYQSTFNALYQGRPTAQEGNIVKKHWFNWYNKNDLFIRNMPKIVLSVDATFKDTAKSDKVAIHVWGKSNANYFLIDRINARMDIVATMQAIRNMLNKYPNIRTKLIEDKANGSAIITMLNREIGGFVGVNPLGSKEARLHSVLPYFEAGNVHLPTGEEWTNEYIETMCAFPNGQYDDDVDATSQAIYRMSAYDAMYAQKDDDDPHYKKKTVRDMMGTGNNANKLAKWG